MGSRALPTIAVVVLVVLSGCNGLGNGTTTATPAPTDEVTFPGDASRFGLGDVADLRSAHEAALQDANYRASLVVETNLSRRGIEGTNRTVHVGNRDGERYLHVRDYGEEAHGLYVGPTTEYTRYPASDEHRYRYQDGGFGNWTAVFPRLQPWPTDRLVGLLEAGSFRFEGTTERDGTTLLRYGADGVLVSREGNYSDYAGTLLVSQDGVVHRANGSFVEVRGSGDDTFRQRVTFDWSLSTDVAPPERPGWTTAFPNLQLSVPDDGAAVLENVRGATVPAGTTVEGLVGHPNGSQVRVNTTLDAALAPGEQVVLYLVDAEAGYELRASTDRSSVPDSAVRMDGGLLFVSGDGWWAEVSAPWEEDDE